MKQQISTLTCMLAISFSIGCSSSDFAASSEKRQSNKKNGLTASGSGANDGQDGGDSVDQEDGSESDSNDSGNPDSSDGSDADAPDSGDSDEAEEGNDSKDNDKKDDDDPKVEEGDANVCDNPSGEARAKITVGGEDVPGNGLVGGPDSGKPLGSDFDDYKLDLEGELTREGALPTAGRIGMKKKGSVTINYIRGTTACSHDFAIVVRRCPNKDAKELARHKLIIGSGNSGSTSFKVTHDNVYLDIVMTVSGSSRNDFGGCGLPFPLTNKLYGNAMPGFIL